MTESRVKLRLHAIVAAAALGLTATAGAQERLGPVPTDRMTDAQKTAYDEFFRVRQGDPFGFWWGYMRVPEVLIPFLEIQTYIHEVIETENSAIGEKLTHFAMLIVARHWTQQVIWDLHEEAALASGLKPEVLDALAAGRRPPDMTDGEEIVYDFCIELLRNHSVSDATYDRMVAQFGERGVAEVTLLQGEYTLMSMFMNVARTPLDPGTPPPLQPFPR
jgi:4-carboxymuconolactone decarboxylase